MIAGEQEVGLNCNPVDACGGRRGGALAADGGFCVTGRAIGTERAAGETAPRKGGTAPSGMEDVFLNLPASDESG